MSSDIVGVELFSCVSTESFILIFCLGERASFSKTAESTSCTLAVCSPCDIIIRSRDSSVSTDLFAERSIAFFCAFTASSCLASNSLAAGLQIASRRCNSSRASLNSEVVLSRALFM